MKLRRPSPALLIACLALFISLGGVSYGVATGFIDSRELKNNTIRTQDIRNNDIRGKDIRNSTIRGRDVAFNTLTGSDISESRLTTVPNADKVDGIEASGLVKTDPTGFVNLTLGAGSTPDPSEAVPALDVDSLGYVHLRGSLLTNGSPAFTLPVGTRPATESHFVATDNAGGSVRVDIETDGDVEVTGATTVAFDGITFRAGG